ncbi:hypothetical protein ALC56_06207 [Trachymyrmex septentrionalis]|uniref:Uncharacterized protein n=1 Tax=Trachymyrmex septentrionalis TaxID=34720 RepID=A0A151JXB4_9HYME|nr:hypothetical protein ALC56_06207 [Trachymyrmex septentrionalis]
MVTKESCSTRTFASFIGSLVSVCLAVQYDLLYIKSFEREKFLTLSKNNDDRIRSRYFVREIFTDASLNGWGASWTESHGWWSTSERSLHINTLKNSLIFWLSQRKNLYNCRCRIQNIPDTEWSLSHKAFREVIETFGPFKIDLFASLNNSKCKSYVSWFPDPGAIAVNAFTLSWKGLHFYAFSLSLFILLPRVLRKIMDGKATGTVVVAFSSLSISQ